MRILLYLFFLLCISSGYAQMYDPILQDTLYGNEWIDYEQTYLRIPVAADGVYRIDPASLPIGTSGSDLRLFHLGKEVPLYVSTAGSLDGASAIEFYGRRNRNEVDRHLWEDPTDQLNPNYSLVTDTSAYYLSWVNTGTAARFATNANDLTDVSAPLPWFLHRETLNFHSHYTKKYEKRSGLNVYRSKYDLGEGFASNIGAANPAMVLTPTAAHPDAASAEVGIRLATNVGNHQMEVRVNGDLYVDEMEPAGYNLLDYTFQVPLAAAGGPLAVTVADVDAANTNRQAIAEVYAEYRRAYDFGGADFFQWTVADSPGSTYFEITNVDLAAGIPVIYDLTNRTRTVGLVEDGMVKAALPPGAGDRQLILTTAPRGVSGTPRSFVDYRTVDADFLLLAHPVFINDVGGVVQEYASFRARDFSTAVINVEELYEQFAYGLSRHPIGIRNFASWYRNRTAQARHLLLLGKGRETTNLRTAAQVTTQYGVNVFIPTMGFPGTDNMLVSYPGSPVSQYSLGRISAESAAEVAVYLDKLKGYEEAYELPQTAADRAWMKRFIHLGGGGNDGEQNAIKNGLFNMETKVETNAIGANVVSFYKSTTDAIQTSVSAAIFNEINSGAALITFFGHSSPGNFDFNIDNPDNYQNEGRYPVIISLGCYSGEQFSSSKSLGERFLLYENKGAIGFGASRGYGFITMLNIFGNYFYEISGSSHYGATVGELFRETARHFAPNNSLEMQTLVEQFGYQGDPAVRLYPQPGPDYVVTDNSIQISPERISLQADSIDVNFSVTNIGRTQNDSLSFRIEQQLPDGTVVPVHTFRDVALNFQSAYSVKLANQGRASVGLNRLRIQVDSDGDIGELPAPAAEMNNDYQTPDGQIGHSFLVADNVALPVYPYKFGIVNSDVVTLRALTADPLAEERPYVMEIDTQGDFAGPGKKRTVISQSGGVLEWRPDVDWTDGRTYFWRISPDLTNGLDDYLWEQSSFTYLPDSPAGWSQDRHEQFSENDLRGLAVDSTTLQLGLAPDIFDFRIKNKYYEANDRPIGYVNNRKWSDFYRFNIPQSMTVVVLDQEGRFWFNWNPGEYGSVNVNAARIAAYPFRAYEAAGRDSMINFLTNVIPDGHTVFVYNAMGNLNQDLNVADWQSDSLNLNGQNLFNVLEAQGAGSIRQLENNMVPYIFGYIKGEGPLYERMAENRTATINMELALVGFLPEGEMRSQAVGPSASWGSLEWAIDTPMAADSLKVGIEGKTVAGNWELLSENITDATVDLTAIDAAQYPYLRLIFFAHDATNLSIPRFEHWRVLYEPLPDVVHDLHSAYELSRDTLPAGEPLRYRSAITNVIDNTQLDSVSVVVSVADAQGNERRQTLRSAPVAGGESAMIEFELDTRGLSGPHQFLIELNANDEQREVTRANNYLQKSIYVERDRTNPTLDVTFDGRRIMNGDLISAKPVILVQLDDDNDYLLMSDTSHLEIQVRDPNGTVSRAVLGAANVSFQPATADQNRATITYRPEFTEDGVYHLSVQGTDASSNLSGSSNYEVDFEVITKSSISNVLNYPNPFTTLTRFVYTLTGSEAPERYRIQIMTASGRVVRTLTETDLGPLEIGTHQTVGGWDGRDEFGDQLAKGVYIYTVMVDDVAGKAVEAFDNGTDQFFRNGMGKMVLLR